MSSRRRGGPGHRAIDLGTALGAHRISQRRDREAEGHRDGLDEGDRQVLGHEGPVVDGADGGVGALGAVEGVRRGERRRLTARGARAREDEERLGDELCEGGGAVRRAILAFLAAEFPAFPRAFRDDRR